MSLNPNTVNTVTLSGMYYLYTIIPTHLLVQGGQFLLKEFAQVLVYHLESLPMIKGI